MLKKKTSRHNLVFTALVLASILLYPAVQSENMIISGALLFIFIGAAGLILIKG